MTRIDLERLELITRRAPEPTQATPLLFIHGAFAGAWCWDEYFLSWFAERGYTAHALSLRGHGASDGREGLNDSSIADYVDDVIHAVERMPAPPLLIGHSMGGFVVQKHLEHASAPGAVLMASVPPQGLLSASISLAFSKPGLFADLNSMMHRGRASLDSLQKALFANPVTPDDLRTFNRLMQPESQRAIWDMTFFDLPRLARERCPPLLVLGAEHDVLVPPSQAEQIARAYGTEAEIFPDMGHAMMLETGWQKVADRIIAWLRATKLDQVI